MLRSLLTAVVCLLWLTRSAALAHGPTQPPHQLYRIGDLAMESGEVIKDFSISYVTQGTLSARKSNAILMVTAIGGHHHRLDFLIGRVGHSTRTSISSSASMRSATGSPLPRQFDDAAPHEVSEIPDPRHGRVAA
jgi:hypothetical protein